MNLISTFNSLPSPTFALVNIYLLLRCTLQLRYAIHFDSTSKLSTRTFALYSNRIYLTSFLLLSLEGGAKAPPSCGRHRP